MPVHPFEELTGAVQSDQALVAMAGQLTKQEPGIVLASGQAASGKLTMLLALAKLVSRDVQEVLLFSSSVREYQTFHPLPAGWREQLVSGGSEEWQKALDEAPPSTLLVIADLSRESAPAVWGMKAGRWIFATVDTPLIGPDVAYAMRELGVPYEGFLLGTRCIWSMLLLSRMCPACAESVDLSDAELEYLLPGEGRPGTLLAAKGCPSCDGRGTANGKLAACDVLLITDGNRQQVSDALSDGKALHAEPLSHITVHEQARCQLAEGGIGVDVYRDAVRRNPLLRAQNNLQREQAHSHRLGTVFEKFVSPEVKKRLMGSSSLQAVVRGESREVTCLFCDMRGFTTRAESREPEVLFAELNNYFAEVVDCVLVRDGTIDKFIGDAVMVVWGAPTDQPDHARRAVECAIAIRQRIAVFNQDRSADLPMEIGIGINTGRVMAGCIGTDQRMEYTVLGDAVNIASRLEARARPGQILVSAATRDAAGEGFSYSDIRVFELKGKSAAVQAFEILERGDA